MKKVCIVFTLFMIAGTALAQSFGSPSNLVKDGKNALLLGYNYNQGHWCEAGIVRGFRYNYLSAPEMPAIEILYPYVSLSSQFLIKDKFLMCPEFGYHFVLGFVDIGANVFDYTDLKKHNFGIQPEVGLTFTGLFGLYYSYNIMGNKNFDISVHNFGVKTIIGSGLFIDKERRDKRLARKSRR